MNMDRWISAHRDERPEPGHIVRLTDDDDVDCVIVRETIKGALLMVRVRPGGSFEKLLLSFAPGDGARCGPGAPHETDPGARIWEAGSRLQGLSRATGAAMEEMENALNNVEVSAWDRVTTGLVATTNQAEVVTLAVLAAYSGLLPVVTHNWTSAKHAMSALVAHFNQLRKGSMTSTGVDLDRRTARLVATWTMSLLSTGGIEVGHPLQLGPRALHAMMTSVIEVEQLIDALGLDGDGS